MVTTKTKTGIDVILSPVLTAIGAVVRYKMEAPYGTCTGTVNKPYGFHRDGKTEGVQASCSGMMVEGKKIRSVFLTIPKADYDKAFGIADDLLEAHKEEIENGNQKIETGEVPIELHYHDGEYLSGFSAHDYAADLLKNIGLAKEISGWGVIVDSKAVEALGTTFTYPAACAFAQPAIDEKAAKKEEKEKEEKDNYDLAMAEAARTGKSVLIRHWSEECNDPKEECNFDKIYEYAIPDGSTKRTRVHTY